MRIVDCLSKNLMLLNLGAKNKIDCLMECAETVARNFSDLKKDEIADVLLDREKLGSTGIQDGIAIPHGKFRGLQKTVILFARSLEGIDFQSYDGKPTHLFFVLLAPEETTSEHLKLLARLSRLLKNNELRNELLKAKNEEGITHILEREDDKLA